ncbi:MAG TPA: RNA 2',3'-cyclic phosphodiesterase [Sphingobium sp.]|uniref:RNA 2',3'-cyclic phosphodiesterase n=1 Tax=Sphingobium sp. TaxID=1912891 RepID=UPI002ED39467
MRLFYALMPSDRIIEALQPLMQGVSAARWQTARQLHLTLRFVGDVSGRVADDLADSLPAHVAAVPPVALSGVGFFEANKRPNALWVRATPREPLAQLHRKMDRACQDAGLEPERRAYIPHITVARLPRSAGPIESWVEDNAGFTTEPMRFARCSLVESILTEDGSHYEELAWVTLR